MVSEYNMQARKKANQTQTQKQLRKLPIKNPNMGWGTQNNERKQEGEPAKTCALIERENASHALNSVFQPENNREHHEIHYNT